MKDGDIRGKGVQRLDNETARRLNIYMPRNKGGWRFPYEIGECKTAGQAVPFF